MEKIRPIETRTYYLIKIDTDVNGSPIEPYSVLRIAHRVGTSRVVQIIDFTENDLEYALVKYTSLSKKAD
jgi:hypothetical protein